MCRISETCKKFLSKPEEKCGQISSVTLSRFWVNLWNKIQEKCQ